jgi:hypothetical protein
MRAMKRLALWTLRRFAPNGHPDRETDGDSNRQPDAHVARYHSGDHA